MAPKRRGPAPPPPAPPPQESGSDDSEEDSPRVPAAPQNRQPPAPANAAHGDDGDSSEEDEGSDSETDAQAFQLRQVSRSSDKPPAPQLGGRAFEDEEDSGSSESEDELPESVQKKRAAAVRESKAEEARKMSAAPEPASSGKAKTEAGKKSKKGQGNKEKIDGNTKGGAKKNGSQKEEMAEAPKGGMSKEKTTTGTIETGGAFARDKKEKTDKVKACSDLVSVMPKEDPTATENDVAPKKEEEETYDVEIATDASRKSRDFTVLQDLYSNLSVFVEGIEAQHPCGKILKRAFEFIDDEKASDLESKIRDQRLAEMKAQNRQARITRDVFNLLMDSMYGEE